MEPKQENIKSESNEEITNSVDFINKYNELKNNTVEKQKYESLLQERNELVDKIVNGMETPKEEPEVIDPEELRKTLFSEDSAISNLEYAKAALKLRKYMLSQKEPIDPFVPTIGLKNQPTDYDYEVAERVAETFQECIDKANGDSAVFTSLLNSRTVDSMPMRGPRR